MKHRLFAILHSQICVQQQDVVIAPDAPMARRLAKRQACSLGMQGMHEFYEEPQLIGEEEIVDDGTYYHEIAFPFASPALSCAKEAVYFVQRSG